jgi:hypothetical protein
MDYDVVVGIDPGLSGGITVLDSDKDIEIFKMPLKKIVVNKKNKNTYNMIDILDIFKEYKNKKVLFYIEKQSVRQGEGAVSAMTIGKNYGQLLGLAYALNFHITEISPVKWKKQYPQLITQEIINKKAEIKELRLLSKTIKENDLKKENKRQVDKLNRQVKAEAKTAARQLVSTLYPSLADRFVKKNTDGIAESVLIALYGKDCHNELV